MIIGTCGFASTGSSAVSDYLKEFDENQVLDAFEFTIPYLPDGLEDLEYHLMQHTCRDDSCGIAIPRFRRYMRRYELNLKQSYSFPPKQLRDITETFISRIVQMKWNTAKRTDVLLYPTWFYYYVGFRLMKQHVLPFLSRKAGHCVHLYPYRDVEVSVYPTCFLEASKQFIRDILIGMGADFKKNIVLDQPFVGEDPTRSFHFFDNPKAIVVDRDPRDNYLFTRKVLYKSSNLIPVDRVEDFVKYYRLFRDGHPYKNKHDDVLCLHFEDMVYKYEATTKRIREFCGLGENPRPQSIFSPEISMPNTQLFLRFPEYADDIKYIERELPEYLYDFSDCPQPGLSGKMFEGKSPLNKKKRNEV